MKTFKDIPYGTVERAVPFFYDKPIGTLSKRDSHRMIFMLCDTVKRLSDDIQVLKTDTHSKDN